VWVEIPLLPEAKEAIAAVPHDHLTFLVTVFGKPFTAAGFGNKFHDWCKEAGITTGSSAHGLRGAGATQMKAALITRSWPGVGGRRSRKCSAIPGKQTGGGSHKTQHRSSQREHRVANRTNRLANLRSN
jgi:hypothetical protein